MQDVVHGTDGLFDTLRFRRGGGSGNGFPIGLEHVLDGIRNLYEGKVNERGAEKWRRCTSARALRMAAFCVGSVQRLAAVVHAACTTDPLVACEWRSGEVGGGGGGYA